MRKCWAIFTVFCFFILTSCMEEEQHLLKEVNQDVLIYTQISTVYDHDEILDTLSQNDNMFTICEILDIDKYKSTGNSNYIVLQTTTGLFLVLFDCNGNHATMHQIKFSPISNKNSVSELKVGMTLENARAADPAGQYAFLLHSSQNYPRISYHYFENGDCFCIKYEADTIIEVVYFTL